MPRPAPAWSPLLVQKVEIHALGFVLHTLQLHRHRAAEVAQHSHPFEQLILFVSGEGWQRVGGQWHQVQAGDLFLIPRNVVHGFGAARNRAHGGARPPSFAKATAGSPGALGVRPISGSQTAEVPAIRDSDAVGGQARHGGRAPPISLVLDYEVKATKKNPRPQHRRLSPALLDDLRRELARIPTKGKLGLAHYPAVLEVIARLLDPQTTPANSASGQEWARAAHERVREPGSLAAVARATGYHRDHLTRKLKQTEGLGLRALRDRYRLEAAQAALRGAATVGEAAEAAGFDDANYFARWFRRRTGQTPTAYKN